jgi:tetratricopeptide (TPR) repeat protein
MTSLITTHPLERMAAQLAHACRMRDVRVLNRWLSGQGLPRLSQEGELPHELLWQLIYEWWQPNPPELEACQQLVCDALDACLQTVNGLSLGQLDGTTGFSSSGMGEEHFGQPAINDVLWPTYCRSLFGLCALLPQHVGLFDRLVALDDTKALGHEALAQLAVGQSLQQALVEQQVDDRLVTRRWKGDFDLAMGQIGANRWQEPAATVLASWRAMVLAFADGGATDQVRKPALLAALNRVSQLAEQWPQRAESVDQLLAHMLAQWPATQAGQALVWRAALLAAPLPERVHAVTKDLWPHSGAVDGWLLAEPNLATGWRKLGRVGREAVRQCANEGDAERLAAIQFSLLQAGKPRPWVSELVGALRQHVPALRTDGPDVKAFKQLKVADDEAITEELPTEAVLSSGPRSNYDRFLATTQSIADVTRLLARQKFDVAIRRARELLGRQAADRTPQELQSKTAANLATAFAEVGRYSNAKDLWRSAINLNSFDPVARCGLAEVLKELGDLGGAKVQYQETMRSHPQDVVARNGLADVLKELGDLEGAKVQYQETMRSHPQNVVARNGLANVLRRLKQFAQAQKLVEGWSQAKGRQRVFDGVVYALSLLPTSGDQALAVLSELQRDATLRLKDRDRLKALATSISLKQDRSAPLLAAANEKLPLALQAWISVVRQHQQIKLRVERDEQVNDVLRGLSHQKEKVMSLLHTLSLGSDAANDELFELEVEALLAA